jgi:methyl-accepting chemotaxis protein|nr:methyl-accepting chemotaxis protein [uncultured Desulfuromonas sp.]
MAEKVKDTQTHSFVGIRTILLGLVGLAVLTAIGISSMSMYFLATQKKDAPVINIAGRQRMLSQKMSKEVLMVAASSNASAAKEQLRDTKILFDRSLKALIDGDSDMGLPATSEGPIHEQLLVVKSIWEQFSPKIKQILTHTTDTVEFQNALKHILSENIALLTEMNKAVQMFEANAREKVQTLEMILFSGIALAVLVFVVCAIVLNGLILRPVRQLIIMIKALERGDLTQRLKMKRCDEIGEMAKTMDGFADNLEHEILSAFEHLAQGDFTFQAQGLIREPLAKANTALNDSMGQVQLAAEQIAAGSEQISETSQTLSQAATEQASSLEQITSSMADMGSRTKQNADNAVQVNQLAEKARDVAGHGNSQMQDMVAAMAEINESAQDISRIIKVIDEIAFQTNLLALNAAVEAARAGQHGKGFAVVAEEVRNLAARSAKAASETAALIDGAVSKAGNGTQIAQSTADALTDIVQSITKVTDLVGEITASSDEQSQGIAQIHIGLEEIDKVTQQNTSNAVQSAATGEQLAAQSAQMREMLAGFKLHNGLSRLSFPC